MDALTLLKQDHRTVEALFKRFEEASDKATKLKRKLVDQIITELSKHAAIEESVLYPAARAALKGNDDIVLESLEEHHIVKWTLNELIGMSPDAERFDAKVTVLIESVRHHVKEEEQDLFKQLRKVMKRDQLVQLGEALERAKKVAPTKPHPRSPDQPPGNLFTSPVAAVVDRAGDMVKAVVRGRRKAREESGATTH